MTTYNNGKTLKQAIRDEFNFLLEPHQITIWNEFCEANHWYGDIIYSMDSDNVNLVFGDAPPAEVAKAFRYANYNDRYFTYNGDTVDSFDKVESAIDLNELIDWLAQNKNYERFELLQWSVFEDEEEGEDE